MTKRIFITGASSGLGKATAKLFAEQGFKVTLDPNGVSELYLFDDDTGVETRIPIRYDYDEKGFFIDGIIDWRPLRKNYTRCYYSSF